MALIYLHGDDCITGPISNSKNNLSSTFWTLLDTSLKCPTYIHTNPWNEDMHGMNHLEIVYYIYFMQIEHLTVESLATIHV